MKRIYLGGPMTGIPQFNFPAFDAAEVDLLDRGYDVVPPADLHDPVVRPQALASVDGSLGSVSVVTWGDCLSADVKMIADDGIEAIVLMTGWDRSRGARLEAFVGRLCGLPLLAYGPTDPLLPVPTGLVAETFAGVAA
jgi:hypothetical protein